MYMLSIFNVSKTINEVTWVYNTLTASFIKMETELWNSLPDNSDKELIETLVKQGILVNDNNNEIQKYKYFYYNKIFDKTFLSLSVAPTMKCNFRCKYCFEGDHKKFSKMTKEVEEALIHYIIKKSKQKDIHINWFGGEPLLAFDTILSICDKLNSSNVHFTSSMVTNGSLFTPKIINNLYKLHLRNIQITLDGTAETHNKRRFYKNGTPSFYDIENNIKMLLHNTNIKLTIQVGVDIENHDAYENLYEYLKKRYNTYLEKNRLLIGCNNIQNRTDFEGCSSCFTEEQIFDRKKKYLQENKYPALIQQLPGLSLPCMYRSSNNMAIDSKGYIYRCLEHLGQPQHSIGNIVEYKVSLGKMAKMTFENDPFDDAECHQCKVLPICGGGCPIDRKKGENKGQKSYCSIYKKYIEEMLPLIYENQNRNSKL